MSRAHLVVTVLASAGMGFGRLGVRPRRAGRTADCRLCRPLPHSWWGWSWRLGTTKAAGAVGLLVGLFAPLVGVVTAIGLVLCFIGAVVTIVRARSYRHIPFPLLYLAPDVALGYA